MRLAALIGIGQSAAIGLTVSVAPHEWSWAYAMMIGIHLVLLLTASARYASVDAVWAATAAGEGARASRRLLVGWGVVLGLIGIAAGIASSDKDFRAPVGDVVGYVAPDSLEVSVGQYNMLAALILLAVAVLMLVGRCYVAELSPSPRACSHWRRRCPSMSNWAERRSGWAERRRRPPSSYAAQWSRPPPRNR